MQYKIIVDKQPSSNPSSKKKEYVIDIEELRVKGNVYDSLNIELNRTYVTRRLSLSEYGVLSVLDEPIIEELTDLDIKLFEGDNYIYLSDMEGNHFYAEYLIKNDFNDIYVNKNEMNSSITQTAQKIELSVNQKLTGYSTTQEMNSAITVKANEITSSVSKSYATKTELNTAKSEIKQTTDSITSTVSTKVGKNEVISRINQSAEAVQINANKISLEGKEINLTGDDITIESEKLKISEDGKITITAPSTNTPNYFVIEDEDGNILLTINGWGLECKGNTGINSSEIWAGNTLEEYVIINRYGITVGDQSKQSIIRSDQITTPKLNQTSLESIKKNINKFTQNATDIINNSDIYEYNLKSDKDEEKKMIGFVIGDNYKTPDEVISRDGQAVGLYSAIGILWKGFQEQEEEIKQLQENDKQKDKLLADLILRVEQLEKEVQDE